MTLTNKTGKGIAFKRPEPLTNRFGLSADHPGGIIGMTMFDVFERSQEVFSTDPVVIKAGESLRLTRPIEPFALGEHASRRRPDWATSGGGAV